MASRSLTLTNTIHLRDFVDCVTNNPTRLENNYIEIQADINIVEENRFHSTDVIVEPIRTRIRAYVTPAEREVYVPSAFFYAEGRFVTALTSDDRLEITVHALSLMRYVVSNLSCPLPINTQPDSGPVLFRHPGDVSDFDNYRSHLPEQWCPMVTIIGSVGTRSEKSLDQPEPREFELKTSVYDPPTAGARHFSVVCFFESGRRWGKVTIPPSGAHISVTAKIVGRTINNHLALRVLDFAYLPRPTSTSPVQNTPSPLASKRSYRWGGRINTPSKKIRTSEVGTGSAAAPHTPPAVDNDEADLQLADHTSPSSTPADPEHISDSDGRPRRRRRPRKVFDP
jgi:hypothetical protein